MTVHIIDVIQNLICDHTEYGNRPAKAINHVNVTARVCHSFQRHAQSLDTADNRSLRAFEGLC